MSDLYSISEWQARQHFVRLIEAACKQEDIAITWLSDYWLGVFEKNGISRHIHGYQFPINDTVAANIMHDKVSMYELLTHRTIAAIPHFLIRLHALPTTEAATKQALKVCALPFVLKPDAGWSGGVDVFKCETETEARATIQELATRHSLIAVSPFIDIKAEYRVLLFDNEPKVVYEKIRPQGVWHHNLKQGAVPSLVRDTALHHNLVAMARKAMAAVRGRLAAVDIVDTPAGLAIMELNCGISLSIFSTHSHEYKDLSQRIYADILRSMFSG